MISDTNSTSDFYSYNESNQPEKQTLIMMGHIVQGDNSQP